MNTKNPLIYIVLIFATSMTAAAEMKMTSPAFKEGERIRVRYTGESQDLSPALTWTGVPENTKELALIVDDPDAPSPTPWVHWVVCKIPPKVNELPEGVKASDSPEGIVQGKNSWNSLGYRGPLPPPGHGTHHYQFHLYALNAPLTARSGLSADELHRLMQGKIIGEVTLVGTYER